MTVRVAIVGPTSYTGLYLIRILLRHPEAAIAYLASQRDEPVNIAAEFPQLMGRCDMTCRPIDPAAMAKEVDVAFCCVPHAVAMQYVPGLLEAGLRVVDLSADYRLLDVELYEKVYQHKHSDPRNLEEAAYGLPELFADDIPEAALVANPGCYPTGAALGIAPLLERGLVKTNGIVISAASGVTGAGRKLAAHLQFAEVNEGFAPYNVGVHRHQPEIEQTLSAIADQPIKVLFVPHLLPVNCGILSSIYLDPATEAVTEDQLFEAFESAYADEPFIRVRNDLPNIKHVRDTNFCDITVRLVGGKVVVFTAIDNMVKGASGQAIQNMNLMFGLDPTTGLV